MHCQLRIIYFQDHVGQDFRSLSFYHSARGQEYLTSQGSLRLNNPPAVSIGDTFYQENPVSENDPLNAVEGAAAALPIEPEFIMPSSPDQNERFSRQFH